MRASALARRVTLLLMPTVIVFLCVGVTTSIAISVQQRSIRAATEERVRDVATTLSANTQVRAALEGLTSDNSAEAHASATENLQPLASLVEHTAGVDFVVITDAHGIRLTHPTPRMRGEVVSTDLRGVLAGDDFLGTEVGTLGPTLRAKVAVSHEGEPLGALSVGILESSIKNDSEAALSQLLPWAIGALLFGTVTSSLVSAALERRFRRQEETVREFEGLQRTATALHEQSHEFHTRLHVIHGLVSHGDTREALDYIEAHTPVAGGAAEAELSDRALLRATIEAVRSELAALGAHLETAFSVDHEVDHRALFVITNLCRNAGEAGATLVRCTLSQHGHRISGRVEDNGPGIDPPTADRIFARGYTTKSDPTGIGRGIGLDMVRRTVASRGGTVELSRSPLGGARFTFEMGCHGDH